MRTRRPITRERMAEIQRDIERNLQERFIYCVYSVRCDCGHVEELRHSRHAEMFNVRRLVAAPHRIRDDLGLDQLRTVDQMTAQDLCESNGDCITYLLCDMLLVSIEDI